MGTYTDEDYVEQWGHEAAEWLRRMRDEIAAICDREGWVLQPHPSSKNGYVFKHKGKYNCFTVSINPVWLGVPEDQRLYVVQIRFVSGDEAVDKCPDGWQYAGDEGDAGNFVLVEPAARAEALLPLLRLGYERVVGCWP